MERRDDGFGQPSLAGITVAALLMLAITTTAVGLRCWVRIKIARGFTADDWWLVVAQSHHIVGLVLWPVQISQQTRYPAGSKEQFDACAWILLLSLGLYYMVSIALKISVALFFLKITHTRWQRWLYQGSTIFYCLFLIGVSVVVLCRCGKLDPTQIVGNAHCKINWNVTFPLGVMTAMCNALCDWIFVLMPLYQLYTTPRTSIQEKFSMYVLIGLACSGSVVSIIRILHVGGVNSGPYIFETDVTIVALTWLEPSICITTAALLRLKPLLGMFMEQWTKIKAGKRQEEVAVRDACRIMHQLPRSTITQDEISLDMSILQGLGVLPDVSWDAEKGISTQAGGDSIQSLDSTWRTGKFVLESIHEVEGT